MDDEEIERLLEGLDLPDVGDCEDWDIPPRIDDTEWEWGE